MGILVQRIRYTKSDVEISIALPKTIIYRLTKPPMTGAMVKEIQSRLKAAGFHPGPLDGLFGAQTQAAVVAYQASRGMTPDGEVGPRTAKALGCELPVA